MIIKSIFEISSYLETSVLNYRVRKLFYKFITKAECSFSGLSLGKLPLLAISIFLRSAFLTLTCIKHWLINIVKMVNEKKFCFEILLLGSQCSGVGKGKNCKQSLLLVLGRIFILILCSLPLSRGPGTILDMPYICV